MNGNKTAKETAQLHAALWAQFASAIACSAGLTERADAIAIKADSLLGEYLERFEK